MQQNYPKMICILSTYQQIWIVLQTYWHIALP